MKHETKSFVSQLFSALPLLYAGLLPIYPHGAIYIAVAWACLGLWQSAQASWKTLGKPAFWMLTGFFWWHLIGMFYTDFLIEGWDDIRSKLMLLALPLYFAFFPPPAGTYRKAMKAFAWGILISACLSLLLGMGSFVLNGDHSFKWHDMLGIHPTYYSMYTALGYGVWLYQAHHTTHRRKRIWMLLAAHVLLFFTLLLASRTGVGIVVLISLLAICYDQYYYKGHSISQQSQKGQGVQGIGKRLFLQCLWLGSILIVIWLLPNTQKKINRTYSQAESFTQVSADIRELDRAAPRALIWSAALDLLEEEPFVGYGTGAVGEQMKMAYGEMGYANGVSEGFNPHNQFLQSWLGQGWIGLLLLCIMLGYAAYRAYRQQNLLQGLFLLISCITMLTESILEREAGILFVGFWLAIGIYEQTSSKSTRVEKNSKLLVGL